MTAIAFPLHKPATARSAASSASASASETDARAVLVVYQPVFRHHAHDASVPGTPGSPPQSLPIATPSYRRTERSPPPSPPPLSGAEEEGRSLLDPEHSRSVDALQSVGQGVAQYLARSELRSVSSSASSLSARSSRSPRSARSSRSSPPNVSIDCISILPASYIRSFHHTFAQRQKATISRAPSPVDRPHRKSLLGSVRAHSPDRKVHRSDSMWSLRERTANSRAGSIFASMIHPGSGSSMVEGNATPSGRSATEQLLELTDDLRIEDEASEETREQILDRLTVLAGELEAGADGQEGVEMFVSTDVQQAHDGETLAQAIVRLAHAKRYEEIVVVNDVDWAAEPTSGRRNLHLSSQDHDERDQTDWLTPLRASPGHTTPSSPLGRSPSHSSDRAGGGFPFPHTPTGLGSSPSRRLSLHGSFDNGRSLGWLFGHSHTHNHGHGHGHGREHPHFPSLSLGIAVPHLRSSRREGQDQAEVGRVLVTQTHRLARQLCHDMKGVQVTLF